MKIVFLNGGLANQVFQYIFYRYAQINAPEEEWYLDDSFFFIHHVHNGYELNKVFGLEPNLLSNYFDPDVWEYMIRLKREQNRSIPQILLDNDVNINMLIENKNWDEWNPFQGNIIEFDMNSFDPKVVNIKGAVYYHGYWLTSEWFHSIEKEIRHELCFSDIDDGQNAYYRNRIRSTQACSIHIRRGDYITLGASVPNNIYRREILTMMEQIPDITLFVFSDDMEYCKNHVHEMGIEIPKETIFIEGNDGENAFRDLQLMSQCKYMINGNSSFCYLAALLNTNLQGIINPTGRSL